MSLDAAGLVARAEEALGPSISAARPEPPRELTLSRS